MRVMMEDWPTKGHGEDDAHEHCDGDEDDKSAPHHRILGTEALQQLLAFGG